MEHIPLNDCVQWLKQSQSTIDLFACFFDDRFELEARIEAMWKNFASKWQRIFFEFEEDPLLQYRNHGNSLLDILRLLAKEPLDNATVCCSVKSLLDRKRENSPSAVLERWSSTDAVDNNTIEEFKITYIYAFENLEESEKKVLQGLMVPNEKEDLSLYSTAMDVYRREQTSFCQTMMDLEGFLDKYAKGQLDVIKECLKRYICVIGDYEVQRPSRKQGMIELSEYSVERAVDQWLSGLRKPLPNYNLHSGTPERKARKTRYMYALEPPVHLFTILEQPEREDEAIVEQASEASVEVEDQASIELEEKDDGAEAIVEQASEASVEVEDQASIELEEKDNGASLKLKDECPVDKSTDISNHLHQVDVGCDITENGDDRHTTLTHYAVKAYISILPGHLSFRSGNRQRWSNTLAIEDITADLVVLPLDLRFPAGLVFPQRL